jgi:hypothetical protein
MTIAEFELRLELLQIGLASIRAAADEFETRIDKVEERIK